MLEAIRRNRRRLGRRAATLFFAAFVAGAVAPCVMAATGCPEMKAGTCHKAETVVDLACDAANLLDCQLPDTNSVGTTHVVAIAPAPVILALAPVVSSSPGAATSLSSLRHAAVLPDPPTNLKNAILLI